MKAFGIIMASLLSLVLLFGIAYGISWVMAGPSGALQARQQIKSGDFRIQAYTRFFDQCKDVQTLDAALDESYSELKTAPKSDQERIRINIGAQLNTRNDAANSYNADTHKGYTVGQFKSASLPYELPPYQRGVTITCAT